MTDFSSDFYRQLQGRECRKQHSLFYVEGKQALLAGLQHKADIQKILFTTDNLDFIKNQEIPEQLLQTAQTNQLSQISNVKIHEGIITIIRRSALTTLELLNTNPQRMLVLENINDPANAAGMMRSAVAFNFDGMLFTGSSVDPFNPRVARASMGSVHQIQIAVDKNSKSSLHSLKSQGIQLIATMVKNGISPDNFHPTSPFAIIAGSESQGILPESAVLSDVQLTIPINQQLESLNVSQAMTILLYLFRGGCR